MPVATTFWFPRRNHLLVSLWNRGDAARSIAEVFGVTVNAVYGRIGILRRAGFSVKDEQRRATGMKAGRPPKGGRPPAAGVEEGGPSTPA